MTSPPSGKSGLRDFLLRSDKDKIPSNLQRALSLLNIGNLDALEEQFLATNAFLKPWAVFRDSVLLLQPHAMPRATTIDTTSSGKGIARKDLMWFYTQFDEGARRYDSRADKYSPDYAPNSGDHGVINKSGWGVNEYEKHLYVWLLQEFKVGKVRNPWGFDHLELRSLCTAWEAVFIPIVDAVRASYSAKGRHHYSRLALFVEAKCPSRLAFPEGNVDSLGDLLSPTPYRIVSMPKPAIGSGGGTSQQQSNDRVILTKKHYDETEKELRNVYPQYGGLVERPRFKQKMEEWLAEQRVRADRRKALERLGEVQSFQPQLFSRNAVKTGPSTSHSHQQPSSGDSPSPSPIKRYSENIRRSLSRGFSRNVQKEGLKSPLHGVTRQIIILDDLSASPSVIKPQPSAEDESSTSPELSEFTMTHPARHEAQRKPSEQSVYTSIRNSNLFTEDSPVELAAQQTIANAATSLFSPMSPLSAIPRPLLKEAKCGTHAVSVTGIMPSTHLKKSYDNVGTAESSPSIQAKKSSGDMRLPSYEGTGYWNEISLTKLHASQQETVRDTKSSRIQPATRLPLPIRPTPYSGPLRATSQYSDHDNDPKSSLLSGTSHHKAIEEHPVPQAAAWPGFEEDDDMFVPPVPSKSPERWNSDHGYVNNTRHQQLVNETARDMARIVSKENICAALGDISRESLIEELPSPTPLQCIDGPTRTMSPGGRLHTYNTHLFPRRNERKGTPVGGWIVERKKWSEAGGLYEMNVLEKAREKPQEQEI